VGVAPVLTAFIYVIALVADELSVKDSALLYTIPISAWAITSIGYTGISVVLIVKLPDPVVNVPEVNATGTLVVDTTFAVTVAVAPEDV
jgi:cytochrome b561